MENRKNYRQFSENANYYVQGNTVRKTSVLPKKEEKKSNVRRELTEQERRELRKSNREYRQTYRQNENSFTMSVPYVIFLTVAVVAIVVMCVQYLQLNAEITNTKKNISTLESNIDTIVAQNDSIEYDIEGYIDVDYIMQVATMELGMVNASREQIQYYTSSDTEYMKQYGDIPGLN